MDKMTNNAALQSFFKTKFPSNILIYNNKFVDNQGVPPKFLKR